LAPGRGYDHEGLPALAGHQHAQINGNHHCQPSAAFAAIHSTLTESSALVKGVLAVLAKSKSEKHVPKRSPRSPYPGGRNPRRNQTAAIRGALARTVAIQGALVEQTQLIAKKSQRRRRSRPASSQVQQRLQLQMLRPLTATASRRHQRVTPHHVERPCSVRHRGATSRIPWLHPSSRSNACDKPHKFTRSTTSTYSTRFALVCTTRRSQSAEKINSPSNKEKARKLVSTATVEVIRSRSRTWRDRPSHQMLRPGRVPLHSATFRWAPP